MQVIYTYYFGDFLFRLVVLFIISVYLFYIKKLPRMVTIQNILKKDDLTFKKHFKSKKLRVPRLSFYFLLCLTALFILVLMLLIKFKPSNINDMDCLIEDGQIIGSLINIILILTILTGFFYLGLSIFIIYFCNDPIKVKAAQLSKQLSKFIFYSGLITYQGAHMYTGMSNTEPTEFSNAFDKNC